MRWLEMEWEHRVGTSREEQRTRGATDGGGPRGTAGHGRRIGAPGGAVEVRAGGVTVAGNPVKHPRFRGRRE